MTVTIRRARTSDVRAIRDLVAPLAERRVLVSKDTVAYFEGLQEFRVAEIDGQVVGCGALHVMWDDLAEIRKWLVVFVQRFFDNQFKRSALPNGPKVLPGGAVSPRGDWRMPSDAAATRWLADIEDNVPG